jgi:Raf kinase inhibitor-like YbhB/YbcL family protein
MGHRKDHVMTTIRTFAFLAILCAVPASPALAAPAAPEPMSLTSPAFTDGGIIPDKYTWRVKSPVSPALSWSAAPAGTQSFALIVHDPNVTRSRTSEDYLHWMVFNIPADAHGLPEAVPNNAMLSDGAIQGKATNGKPGYTGMGAHGNVYHHYVFELYALDIRLALGPDATRADLLKAMDGHILAKAVDEGRFHM